MERQRLSRHVSSSGVGSELGEDRPEYDSLLGLFPGLRVHRRVIQTPAYPWVAHPMGAHYRPPAKRVNSSCSYDPRWACPLAPPGNYLDVELTVGERNRRTAKSDL
ncbi:MAG: DUF1684 domain-containing protein [Actinomycetota bacterium]